MMLRTMTYLKKRAMQMSLGEQVFTSRGVLMAASSVWLWIFINSSRCPSWHCSSKGRRSLRAIAQRKLSWTLLSIYDGCRAHTLGSVNVFSTEVISLMKRTLAECSSFRMYAVNEGLIFRQ